MTQKRRFLPGRTYIIEARCPANTYIFKPKANLETVFLPLLYQFSADSRLIIHAYAILPDRHILIVTLNHPEADVTAAIKRLHFKMDQHIRQVIGRTTPIYSRKRYQSRQIHTQAEALLAYTEILTAAQNHGFSSNNEIFGNAIIPLNSIGNPTPTIYDCPECLGNDDAFEAEFPDRGDHGQVSLHFPLIPLLCGQSARQVREQISELVTEARQQINEFRSQANAGEYPEATCNFFPTPPAPRPADETHDGRTYQADFPYQTLLSEDAYLQLQQHIEEENRIKKIWTGFYKLARLLWREGLRNTPFPIGTQKMRFVHHCPIMPMRINWTTNQNRDTRLPLQSE